MALDAACHCDCIASLRRFIASANPTYNTSNSLLRMFTRRLSALSAQNLPQDLTLLLAEWKSNSKDELSRD